MRRQLEGLLRATWEARERDAVEALCKPVSLVGDHETVMGAPREDGNGRLWNWSQARRSTA